MQYSPENGLTLLHMLATPNKKELAVVDGSLSIALTTIDDLPFFLFNFDGSGWIDASFYLGYYPLNAFDQVYHENLGMPLTVLLIDTDTGELKKSRSLGLSTLFSNTFCTECRRLLDTFPILSQTEVSQKINGIYRRYQTSESMLATVSPSWTISFMRE